MRRVRSRVPRLDRARRPHRRPPPKSRHGRVTPPRRDRDDAARRRARVEPVGEAADRACVVGGRARRSRPRAGRSAARDPLLGRLRRFIRRARARLRDLDGEAPARRRARRRDPRAARVVHGRSGTSRGQRVRLPVVRPGERLDARRGGGDEDRRQLSPLLQHARERVPRLRWALRGRAPLGAPRGARTRRSPGARRRGQRRSRTTTPATSRGTTTCWRRHASSSRASGDRSRWRGAASERSAAVPAARTCGWRSAEVRSTRSERARPPPRVPDARRRLPLLHGHARRRRAADGGRLCGSPTSRRSSSRASKEHDELRLRHRRRRLRRLRARQPAQRRSRNARARARGRAHRLLVGRRTSTCRRRSRFRSATRATTGATRPSRSRSWTGAASPMPAARCSAGRARSTG